MEMRVKSKLRTLGQIFAPVAPWDKVGTISGPGAFQAVMANGNAGIARRQFVE